MISLNDFINKTRGKYNDVPWKHKTDLLKKECVSLVQCYLNDVLGQPARARGNAGNWDETYVAEGLGKIVKKGQYGDLIVFNKGTYGHIAIYIDEKTQYDQYNGKKAGYVKMQSNPVFIRPNVKVEPYFVPGKYQFTKAKYVRLSAKVGDNKTKKKSFMKSVQDLCVSDINGYAKTKIGSIWELDMFVFDSNYNIWGRRKGTAKGNNRTDLWICVNDSTGNQAKKV